MYGNHSTLTENPEVAYPTLLKDDKRGYCLVFDPRIAPFILNAHFTPNCLVNPNHLTKEARPIFDSTFRPNPSCYAINDWTSKHTELPLFFGSSFGKFLAFLYNLRITYPDDELYCGNDDMSGSFHHQKYHPNVVAMHSYRVDRSVAVATGTPFGDGPNPPNFEPVAWGRHQLARYLWNQPDTIQRAAVYLPEIELAPPPTPAEIVTFVPTQADSLNRGVLDANGQ